MSAITDLLNTVARLRDPEGGCPWDLEQTHHSLADCLVEEVAEVLQAIDHGDAAHLREELGDLLLQVVMHAQIGAEAGRFDFEAVAAAINEKLIRRHPHVFGDSAAVDTEAVLNQWDAIKATEVKHGLSGERRGLFKSLPPSLPALLYARAVYKQITKGELPVPAPFAADLPAAGGAPPLDEAAAGHALFQIVAACRASGIDPESALRRHADRVIDAVNAAHEGE